MSSVGEDRIYVMWVQSLSDCRVTDRIDVSSHFQTADSWIESTLLGAVIFRLQSRSNRLYVGAVIVRLQSHDRIDVMWWSHCQTASHRLSCEDRIDVSGCNHCQTAEPQLSDSRVVPSLGRVIIALTQKRERPQQGMRKKRVNLDKIRGNKSLKRHCEERSFGRRRSLLAKEKRACLQGAGCRIMQLKSHNKSTKNLDQANND